MSQTFDLNNMGFSSIQAEELQVINGGGFWAALAVGIVGAIATVATGGALAEVAVGATLVAAAH